MAADPKKTVVSYLQKLALEMMRVAQEPDVDAVHDLRVAVRRATQSLRVFADELPSKPAKSVRRQIRRLRDGAAAVRDRDVIAALLRNRRLPAADPALIFLQGERSMAARILKDRVESLLKKRRPDRWIRSFE